MTKLAGTGFKGASEETVEKRLNTCMNLQSEEQRQMLAMRVFSGRSSRWSSGESHVLPHGMSDRKMGKEVPQ